MNLKASAEIKEEAKNIAQANTGIKELYFNEKGEFFTLKNDASLSVGSDSERFGLAWVSNETADHKNEEEEDENKDEDENPESNSEKSGSEALSENPGQKKKSK